MFRYIMTTDGGTPWMGAQEASILFDWLYEPGPWQPRSSRKENEKELANNGIVTVVVDGGNGASTWYTIRHARG